MVAKKFLPTLGKQKLESAPESGSIKDMLKTASGLDLASHSMLRHVKKVLFSMKLQPSNKYQIDLTDA